MNKLCRQILSAMGFVWRDAWRTPGSWLVPLVIAGVLIAMPLCGHAIVDGEQRERLGYALALSVGVVGIVVLWLSCAVVAADIEQRRMILTLTKPIARTGLWVGRWLGIVTICAVLLLEVWCVVAGLQWGLGFLPAGREVVHPQLPAVEVVAQTRYVSLLAEHKIPPGVPRRKILEELARQERNFYQPLEQGVPLSYDFELTAIPRETLSLRIATTGLLGARNALTVHARVNGQEFKFPEFFTTGSELVLPLTCVDSSKLHVALWREDASEAVSLLFRPRKDLVVLSDGYGALNNVTRMLWVWWGALALLAALGLTLGISLSLPVALFVAMMILLLVSVASVGLTEATLMRELSSSWMSIGIWICRWVTWPLRTLFALDALDALLAGELIPFSSCWQFLKSFLCLTLSLAIPGIIGFFKQRNE